MSHIVLGAGLGGIKTAYEIRSKPQRDDRVTVVNPGATYSFVRSNPWVSVGWRQPDDTTVDLIPVFSQRGIELRPEGAERAEPDFNKIGLNGCDIIDYDNLVLATGPDLAFDEVPGLGPDGYTQPICQNVHAVQVKAALDKFVRRRDQLWWVSGRMLHASAPPMNSPSSWRRCFAMSGSAIRCR